MQYLPTTLPFKARRLADDQHAAVSQAGDFVFLNSRELHQLECNPASLPLSMQAELQAKHFLRSSGGPNVGLQRLLQSRKREKQRGRTADPALHIVVPTLQCGHSCRYCQVSRSLHDEGYALSHSQIEAACSMIMESSGEALTVEFQGGDPLLRFDLVRFAIERLATLSAQSPKTVNFVVASTLHQLTPEMCEFFVTHKVHLSTSVDGPADLHNKNRPTPTRDSYERTVDGISLARQLIGPDSVAAVMTATAESLKRPEAIVDEYVKLGFHDIFLRPLSLYGFAKRNEALLGYGIARFQSFYERALERIEHWCAEGYELREVYASIVLNKLLSTFDGGYVDLQSPCASGSDVLVYNYDGYVYPSDEARMLAESGDHTFRMGRIGDSLAEILGSEVRARIQQTGTAAANASCTACAYQYYCAPNPIDAQAQFGRADVDAEKTMHCQRHLALFDFWLRRLRTNDSGRLDRYHAWAACANRGGRQ